MSTSFVVLYFSIHPFCFSLSLSHYPFTAAIIPASLPNFLIYGLSRLKTLSGASSGTPSLHFFFSVSLPLSTNILYFSLSIRSLSYLYYHVSLILNSPLPLLFYIYSFMNPHFIYLYSPPYMYL